MKITQNPNYTNRFDIANISDRKGIRGYNRILGWVLSFFNMTFKFTDDCHRSFYFKRKSAIHLINRVKPNSIKDNAKPSQVVQKLKELYSKPIEKKLNTKSIVDIEVEKIPDPLVIRDSYSLETFNLKKPIASGLNVRFKCINKECKDYDKIKWIAHGIGEFSWGFDFVTLDCSRCKKWSTTTNIGFSDCIFKIEVAPARIGFEKVVLEGQTPKNQITTWKNFPEFLGMNIRIEDALPNTSAPTYSIKKMLNTNHLIRGISGANR